MLYFEYVPSVHQARMNWNLPGDSGQTTTRSICLKFAGPTIRITRHLLRPFLSDEYSAPIEEKQTEAIEY